MNSLEAATQQAMACLNHWWSTAEQPPKTYIMAAGLLVAASMVDRFPIGEDQLVTPGRRLSRVSRIRNVLTLHGETRSFTSESGRTTSSAPIAAVNLAKRLNGLPALSGLTDDERKKVAWDLQNWVVARVTEYLDEDRIEVEINTNRQGPNIIRDILQKVREDDRAAGAGSVRKAGAVAQHLVGAKLAVRYPGEVIENHSSTTADQQLGRPGDFLVGDSPMHVTLQPTDNVFNRCVQNVLNGQRPVLIVPDERVLETESIAESRHLSERMTVYGLEHFVGQNIEEIAGFATEGVKAGMKILLETYNQRVAAAESRQSLMIKIPGNLVG